MTLFLNGDKHISMYKDKTNSKMTKKLRIE